MTLKYLKYGLWALVAICFVGFIAVSLPVKKNTDIAPIQPIAGFNKGAHFKLTSHTGELFDSQKSFIDGDHALLFFGFTHCPVICPTELQKMAEILDGLPVDVAEKVKSLFITIDPERDTASVLKSYVPLFHENIIGLTGDPKNVKSVLGAWKVFYTKVNDPEFTDYTMDHSTYIYLVDHNMTIKAIYRMKNTPEQIIESVKSLI